MPTYEYQCDACEHRFELFQSIKAAPTRKCPSCGKLKVRRLISGGGGLIFKGSGFYITDYRSEGYKSAAKSDSTKTEPTSTSSAGKAETAAPPKAQPQKAAQ